MGFLETTDSFFLQNPRLTLLSIMHDTKHLITVIDKIMYYNLLICFGKVRKYTYFHTAVFPIGRIVFTTAVSVINSAITI